MVRCAVLGSPIAHSLSPAMHRAAYAELGLDWRYDAFEVGEDELRGFLATLGDDVRGLSLTMPLKRVALDLADTVDPVAELIGAANTMLFEPDGSRSAHNTDVPGLVSAFAERGITGADTAVVLGGGATAASTLAALRGGLKVSEVTLVVRDLAKAERLLDLAAALDLKTSVTDFQQVEQIGGFDLCVSTLPGGAVDPWAEHFAQVAPVVFDVAYHPWPTQLALVAHRIGTELLNGLDLLVHQATLQVEMMTGRSPAPLAAMRAAAREELDDREPQ
ncbi:shikimate dehydrogenase [Kribbella italica]|uniref:Shikimate dehydrogenase n=1 Tax=Kribbella italica TaxID=1540520 RepID=A0A7W9J732_9ACTN|nr:shikimate dehydrogenase [Kribbella italica]MBB5836113.1 shikimate dehydrogenase [Kribbella italica]